MGAELSPLLCHRGTYTYSWFRLHLYIQKSETSGFAAEFDASMGTRKGDDLITLELCRGSSRDDEAALEKKQCISVGFGRRELQWQQTFCNTLDFLYCVLKKQEKNLCFELLLIVTVQLKGQT